MQRRASQLTIGFSSRFKRQSAWDVALVNGDIDMAFPATSRNWLDDEETVEPILDCTGRDLLFELVTAQFARLIIDFDVQPHILAGWASFEYGVAAAPSGGANEVQTETVTATGGTESYILIHNFMRNESAQIAFDANAAARTVALEAMPNIGAGNVIVTGTGPYVIAFQGALANTNVALVEVNTALLTGGSSVIAPTTAGVGRTHNISRIAGFALPVTTLYVGFRDSDKQPEIAHNVAANVLRCRANSRERITATVELVCAANRARAVGFTMPPCLNIEPLRFGDSQLFVNGVDQMALGLTREWEYYHDNGILTDDHAFTGQGINPTRWETADVRPSGLNFSLLGESGDLIHTQAKARTPMPFQLNVGPAGNRAQFNIPTGALVRNKPQKDFVGTARESVLRLIGQPRTVAGVAGSPSNITAQTPQATAYLVAA